MTYYRPVAISEREVAELWVDGRTIDDSRWEDCGPDSVLMLVNATTGGKFPATNDEAERLRMAAGYTAFGGTNVWKLAAAAVTRYKIAAPADVYGTSAIWTALTPGHAAALSGLMGQFPYGHRLRRWQPGYTGGHTVYVAREDANNRLWWIDPLAPKGTYVGEWITKAEFTTFLSGSIHSAAVAPLKVV